MMGLHMEGHLINVTNMHEGYMWRLTGNMTEKHTSYTWNVTGNLQLNFIENSSTPWHGAVDQDWRSIKCMHQNMPANHLMGPTGPPECAQPVWQG